jgi:hypothetical protein
VRTHLQALVGLLSAATQSMTYVVDVKIIMLWIFRAMCLLAAFVTPVLSQPFH